jgi:hypothetical protein
MSNSRGRLLRVVLGLWILAVSVAAQPAGQPAKLSKPVNWGTPDQTWGRRRAITNEDRAAIESYRAGRGTLAYSSQFTSAAELAQDWDLATDKGWSLQSCRLPENVVTTSEGLRLKTTLATNCQRKWATGFAISKASYGYGFYEARIRIGDVAGLNNAFWLVTDDNFEIDISEIQFPNYDHLNLQNAPPKEKRIGVGFGLYFAGDLSTGFHDFGVLYTPTSLVYEVDGEPMAALDTHGSVKGKAKVLLSTALTSYKGGANGHPEGHDMLVSSVRVFKLTGQTP